MDLMEQAKIQQMDRTFFFPFHWQVWHLKARNWIRQDQALSFHYLLLYI